MLLTVSPDGAALWSFPASPEDPPSDVRGFKEHPPAAWHAAATALPHSLPLLWASMREALQMPLRAARLTEINRKGRTEGIEPALDGLSFGLSLFLSLASRSLGIPLREDVAASVALDEQGRLSGVDYIAEKVSAVALLAPRVRRLLVAATNEAEAETTARAEGGHCRIVVVKSAVEALSLALNMPGSGDGTLADQLGHWLAAAATQPAQRAEIVNSLFRIAIRGRQEAVDWSPVARAAELAIGWPELSGEQRFRLEFSRAVALRHEQNTGGLALPSQEIIDRLSAPLRLAVLAHYVQQASDTGAPPADEMDEFASRYLARPGESFAPHLRLLGALGRLHAVRGIPARALAMQELAAQGWLELEEIQEISYPLAECYRLAGALADTEALERAERVYSRVGLLGGIGVDGHLFVELARGAARVNLMPEAPNLERDLRTLAQAPVEHPQMAARRWLIRWLDVRKRRTEADREFAALEGTQGVMARLFCTLVRLDRAVASDATGAPLEALEALATLQPGLIVNLTHAAAAQHENAPAYISRFFPY